METLQHEIWLKKITSKLKDEDVVLVKQAMALARIVNEENTSTLNHSYLTQGLITAEILYQLNLDGPSLAAAILLHSVQYTDLTLDDVKEHLGNETAKLLGGIQQMSNIIEVYHGISSNTHYHNNINNIRKMFLAMVDDIRVVIIKLAEQLCLLRSSKILPENIKKQLATEAMTIYAPLCNRLRIAQIKWELEDHAFCFLYPKQYHYIANNLTRMFPKGQQYVDKMVHTLHKMLNSYTQIKKHKITGRAKHIYSIYRKMERKKTKLDGIYDISAIRIFVPTITDCYKVLDVIHSKWQYLQEEFDDYIASPKPNGYRSIHTVIYGPQQRIVEIQIRTYNMHRHAELGIAAHWIYKEGKQEAQYQAKLSWLRQMLDWQHELSINNKNAINIQEIFNNYVYVFTPQGDILELPRGATPIDFAYYIHTELGHRCCGAKVNNDIVPLNYNLKTGDRVVILTAKNNTPSRDWIIPSLGFLITPRAKAKALHWLKKQGQDSILQGQELIEKEIKRLNLSKLDLKIAASKLHFKQSIDLLAALGRGEIKLNTILSELGAELKHTSRTAFLATISPRSLKKKKYTPNIAIEGMGNLLVQLANCCHPIPGEDIVGYITQGHGVSIHRADCTNLLNALKFNPKRHIAVNWNKNIDNKYLACVVIKAFGRSNLVCDITNILAEKNIAVTACNYTVNDKKNIATLRLNIEISGLKPLSNILQLIEKVPNVLEAYRSDNI